MRKAEKFWGMNYEKAPEHPRAITEMGWLTLGKVQIGMSKTPQDDFIKVQNMALGVMAKYPDFLLGIQLATILEAAMGDIDTACALTDKMSKLVKRNQ